MPRTPAESRRRDVFPIMAAALMVAASVGLFVPFEIYLPNRAELDATFGDALPYLMGLTVVFALLLTAIAVALPARARRVAGALLLATGILLWIQSSFLRWGYGELDGRGIDWARFTWQGWVDAAVWVGVLALAAWQSRRFFRNALFVALAFILLQAGSAIVRAKRAPEPAGAEAKSEAPETMPEAVCHLSKRQNVFHIIMDSFQTDVFLDLVDEEGLADELQGFTVFRDNLSVGRRTVICVPAILSGRVFDGATSESEYFREAVQESFHNVLYDNGWVVNLIPHITMENTRYTNYFSSPAVYGLPTRVGHRQTAAYLVDVGLFRQLPHVAKKFIYNEENWRLSAIGGRPPSHMSFQQKAFFRDYISRVTPEFDLPAYHFIHLMPPHPPLVTAADGTYAGRALPNTRENYKNEARYILRLFVDLLHRLEQMGLYDSSIIILQGDHGAGFPVQFDGHLSTNLAGRVSALFALKPAGTSGPLQVSDAPTTIADTPATVMGLLGMGDKFPGESVMRIDPGAVRERDVVAVFDRATRSPVLHHWKVVGAVADTTAWTALVSMDIERELQAYSWGQQVGFGITGNGEGYLTAGWSTTSPTIHWSDGNYAEMTFAVTPPEKNVELKFVFFPHVVPGKVDRQRIIIKVNGLDAGSVDCRATDSQALRLTVNRKVLQQKRMVISFELPDAVSPKELGTGRDPRRLAIGLYSFETRLVDRAEK